MNPLQFLLLPVGMILTYIVYAIALIVVGTVFILALDLITKVLEALL